MYSPSHLAVPAVLDVFTHDISVPFHLIGEEMSFLPTVNPCMCNVFEVGQEALYMVTMPCLSTSDHALETAPTEPGIW